MRALFFFVRVFFLFGSYAVLYVRGVFRPGKNTMRNIPETNRVRLCAGGEGRGWAGAWFTSNVMKRPHSIPS